MAARKITVIRPLANAPSGMESASADVAAQPAPHVAVEALGRPGQPAHLGLGEPLGAELPRNGAQVALLGGELELETALGAQAVKLEAGSMILYPASSLHRVSAVTRGTRLAAFFWIQSLVADEGQRSLLFDLDQSIQRLTAQVAAGNAELLTLTGIYHNLLRRWARN